MGKKFQQELFEFLSSYYVQRQDDRQREMGLIYTEAETHDLAVQIDRFISRRKSLAHFHRTIKDDDG